MRTLRLVLGTIVTVLALVLGSVVVSATVQADQYIDCQIEGSGGPHDGVCGPDDDTHYWCFGGSTDGDEDLKGSFRWSIANMETLTQMNAINQDQCRNYTDVRFQEIDLEGTVRGRYACTKGVQNKPQRCAAADMRVDTQRIQYEVNNSGDGNSEPGELDLNRDKTACHELGHSLGFFHHDPGFYEGPGGDPQKDCMVSGHLASIFRGSAVDGAGGVGVGVGV